MDPNTIPPTSPLPPQSNRQVTLTTLGVGLILAAALSGGVYLLSGSRPTSSSAATDSTSGVGPGSPTASTPPGSTVAPAGDTDAEARRAKELQDAQRRAELEAQTIARRARVTALSAESEAVRDALAQFDERVVRWKAGAEPLRTDEAGKKIAASPTHLTAVATVFARDRVSAKLRASWDEQLDQLRVPVVLAERDPTALVVITEDTFAQLTKLLTSVRAASQELAADQAVLDSAKAATASLTPVNHTLAVAFEQRLAAERQAELTRVEEARQLALKKQADELAALEAKKVEAETETKKAVALAELKKVEFEKKQAELALKTAEEKRKAELAKAQLLAEYERDLPTIKTMLPAFITSGKTHRLKASNGPVSLTAIQSKRALEDSKDGMKAFCHMARQIGDRPQGPIPNFLGSAHDWEILDKDTVRKAQTLIIKYGAIMVEKGLLDP